MQSMRWLGISLTTAFVLLSACGHSGSNAPASVTLSYSAPTAVFTKGAAASVDYPTVASGTVTAYTVTPALPAGLVLDPHTGMITGTPAAIAAQANYMVTAWYAGGSTTAVLSITVNDQQPSALSYTANAPTYTVGLPIAANTPTNSGGAVVSYSVSPNLPAGLSLSMTSGAISGTPSAAVAAASYTVTATNSGGSTTATLTITASASLLATAPATGLSYSVPAPVYATGLPIAPDGPAIGPAGASYVITPTLPQGLSMDPATGIVSGTPSAAPSPTASPVTVDYQVTAGGFSAPLTITLYNTSPATPSVGQSVPNMNQFVTPLAPANSIFQFLDTGLQVSDPLNTNIPTVEWMAGQAVSTAISPDGTTLLVLTSGFNRVFQSDSLAWDSGLDPVMSAEYVFIYNIAGHTPVFQQLVKVPNTYHGLAWDPIAANHTFYVSGGMGDWPYGRSLDNVHIFTQDQTTSVWAQAGELSLGHTAGNGIPATSNGVGVNSGVAISPCAAGVAISSDGQTLVVANYENDSITVFIGGLGKWSSGTELDLRPGKAVSNPAPGTPGGEYPFWVVLTGTGTKTTAYVSSMRDREIDVVSLDGDPKVTDRIPVKGQPNKIIANKAGTLLYVAEDESDTVDVINLNSADTGVPAPGQSGPATVNTVIQTIPVIAPPAVMSSLALNQFTGANTNSVTLSPDENTLYVTNGNLNNVAVVPLTGPNSGTVVGLIPTGWYPNSVSISSDGTWAYVVNSKSPTGPNTNWCYIFGPSGYPTCAPTNDYNPQLTKAGLQSFPIPSSQLNALTSQVIANNHFAMPTLPDPTMQAVHAGIQHVIYILKENRTYDQMLGDLTNASNGDPSLTLFGQAITPNQHALALNFVTLDNFLATAEVSMDGWPWSTGARAPDVIEQEFPLQYASRGLSLDGDALNRSVNLGMPTVAERQKGDPLTPNDPDLLPGQTTLTAPDGPGDEVNTGNIWNAALRAGLTVRNYGFFLDTTCYSAVGCQIPLVHDPFSTNTTVAYPANAALAPYTDPYFRGFDLSFPDYYRYKEWERDFDANYAAGGLPNLSLVRLMHDHTGNFGTAIDGVNTPERDQADNDYAVGLLVQKIANSPIYKDNTLIFAVEDDAQDGGDHVDSHRTTLYVAGAFVKQQAVVSNAHNTIDMVRTMEEVLGLGPMNLNDALATPMSDIFNSYPTNWSFTATPAAVLYCTSLPLPSPAIPCNDPTPNARYWSRVTSGMDFTDADRVDGAQFNRILWKGLMGNRPYPSRPTGKDLRTNREQLLARYRRTSQYRTALTAKPVKN